MDEKTACDISAQVLTEYFKWRGVCKLNYNNYQGAHWDP